MPNLYIIGGADGLGTTTTAFILLPQTLHLVEYVNADEIAKGILLTDFLISRSHIQQVKS